MGCLYSTIRHSTRYSWGIAQECFLQHARHLLVIPFLDFLSVNKAKISYRIFYEPAGPPLHCSCRAVVVQPGYGWQQQEHCDRSPRLHKTSVFHCSDAHSSMACIQPGRLHVHALAATNKHLLHLMTACGHLRPGNTKIITRHPQSPLDGALQK